MKCLYYILSICLTIALSKAEEQTGNDKLMAAWCLPITSMNDALDMMSAASLAMWNIHLPISGEDSITWSETGRIVRLMGSKAREDDIRLMVSHTVFFPHGSERRPLRWHGGEWFDSGPSLDISLTITSGDKDYESAARILLSKVGIQHSDLVASMNETGILYQYRSQNKAPIGKPVDSLALALLVSNRGGVVAFSFAMPHTPTFMKKGEKTTD